MIGEKSPGVAGGLCPFEIGGDNPVQEIISVVIIEEYLAQINPSRNNVVKSSWDIDS